MKAFQQHLLDDKLHAIVVELRGAGDKLLDCRAVAADFVDTEPGCRAPMSLSWMNRNKQTAMWSQVLLSISGQ